MTYLNQGGSSLLRSVTLAPLPLLTCALQDLGWELQASRGWLVDEHMRMHYMTCGSDVLLSQVPVQARVTHTNLTEDCVSFNEHVPALGSLLLLTCPPVRSVACRPPH
jgi:hypothetical protein